MCRVYTSANCNLIISAAQDLVGKLLQPDPQQRAKLDEVMKHPWITKDGLYPLHPYKAAPPDPSAQQAVSDVNVILLVWPSAIGLNNK